MFDHDETLAEARERNVREALFEDIGRCDWTAQLVPAGQPADTRAELFAMTYTSVDCSGSALLYVQQSASVVGQWTPRSTTFTADPNTTYQIRPERDSADLNGISTFDLVDIAKHTLNVTPFGQNGYKFMASDINHNNNVTTFDVVELRKLVLSIYSDFPANTSWRFVKADYIFPDPPLTANLPESIEVNTATVNVSNINFIGVKVGDANFSADPSY